MYGHRFGRVEYDHKNHEMTLAVHVDVGTRGIDDHSATSDARQLSGGEAAFTTLVRHALPCYLLNRRDLTRVACCPCQNLLLAIQRVAESPFHILDEFDVFMDMHTRKIALQQLMDYRKDKEFMHRQFVFITPHPVSYVVAVACPTCLWVLTLAPHAQNGGVLQTWARSVDYAACWRSSNLNELSVHLQPTVL